MSVKSESINELETIKQKGEETTLLLQLGDVIRITNPVNDRLNNFIFIIDYIDNDKMYLINTDTLDRIKLKITSEGIIGDGNISKIAILSRSDSPSYAIQNNLLPGKWVNIHFGGDFPTIITGEITNLEEDMIEVKTSDGEVIYINFDYKGIPEDIPIENIEIREKPYETAKTILERELEEGENVTEYGNELEGENAMEEEVERNEKIPDKLPELHIDKRVLGNEKIQTTIPMNLVKDQLRQFIIRADQIQFGDEELGPVIQYSDVISEIKRYSLEEQIADLLDEMLSTIPNVQRTQKVLNNIHITIERFKQLREMFSFTNQNGVIEGALINDANYKPITRHYFKKFKQNLYWILPVVKNIKKVYAGERNEEDYDISDLSQTAELKNIMGLIETYKTSNVPIDQNKYAILYNDLDPIFTPFSLISEENTHDIIYERNVKSDLNVIIDNLEDMYSSVFTNNNIKKRRFVIQKYNLGLTKLQSKEVTSNKSVTVRVNMTNDDLLSIKSFITLPEPTLRFSKINLPGTSLIEQSNLNQHFLNYWQFLKKKTVVSKIIVDDINNEIEYNENNFLNSIKNYILTVSPDDTVGLNMNKIYNKFVQAIIPKTRILFNLMKKYIVGKLSIVEVVSYLESFLIYTDDLTYKQYEEIVNFISEQISERNKKYIERSQIFNNILRIKSPSLIFKNVYNIISELSEKNNIRPDVLDGYDINPDVNTKNVIFSNTEYVKKIYLKDSGSLYTTAMSLQNIPLMFPTDFSDIFDKENKQIENKIKNAEKDTDCKTFTVSKYYTSEEALTSDNDKTIYFDKKYDSTNYGLLDNYEKEIVTMNPENLKLHIENDLMKKQRLSEKEASYLADSLLDGYKKVLDGHFAILYKGYNVNHSEEISYYVRKDNKWVEDAELNKKINTDESSILCNLQEKCINTPSKIDDKCESIRVDELTLQNQLLNDVINEFDTKYKISRDEFEKNILEKFEYSKNVIHSLSKIETTNKLKYNNQKYKLGSTVNDEFATTPTSPNTKLLNLILNQGDFVKKQYDIVRFVNAYTRQAINNLIISEPGGNDEDRFWLYCIKTGIKMLPIFKFELASAFIKSPDVYRTVLEDLKSHIGKLSDDGDWWCDKYSGWPICPVDLDIEEGYDEGFKVSTRSILEEDAGNKIMSQLKETVKYDTPETRMISNIVNSISVAMGINIETQKEFIINCVISTMQNTLIPESDYKEKIKESAARGKKIASYKDLYNGTILYYTLGMFLISTQTAIPSIKTRKTHPGCVRSFSGFPFEGVGDETSLMYLACISYDIRESGEPWNVLQNKKPDFIANKIKLGITNDLLSIPDVTRKFEEKTLYLLTNASEEIPEEHNIAKWTNFLPPLVKFNIKHLNDISSEFKSNLITDLRTGSQNQQEKILVIHSKIIQFSLALQERIHEIVKRKHLLLHNSNNEPYLENSCCESNNDESTINYFTSKDDRINQYNDTVNRLTHILQDINSYSKGSFFYSDINTKNKYPQVSSSFDEKTIYLSFIYFCKFKSLLPIPEDLIPLCTDKPDISLFEQGETIDIIIQKLKNEGRNYNKETFLRMLQLIGRNNIVDVNVNKNIPSSITKLLGRLEAINDENDKVVEPALIELIKDSLDRFDIASSELSKESKALNNYLSRNIEEMKEDILEFINKNKSSSVSKRTITNAKTIISNFSKWDIDDEFSSVKSNEKISNDNMYKIVNFYKSFIKNIVTVFPNIILSSVNYSDTKIQGYLGLSRNHASQIKTFIGEYYESLKPFYELNSIYNILTEIQKSSNNIFKLSQDTPSFTSIQFDDKVLKPVFDERTSILLFEFYLLRIFINYIDLTDEDEMIITVAKSNPEVQDIFSVDFLDNVETKIDSNYASRNIQDEQIFSGNKKSLKQNVSSLLIAYINMFEDEKKNVDITYENIKDIIFKLKDREKNRITDRLKKLTDEERDADTILKINQLGVWGKGLQKGLTSYDKDMYDEDTEFRDNMDLTEKRIRTRNKNVTDNNIEELIDEYMEENAIIDEIDREVNDISFLNDDYLDGNTDGYDAPEVENDYDYN